LAVEIVGFGSINASKDSREEANSFDNKIVNCDDLTEYYDASQNLMEIYDQ